jgi:hypothetical protein
MSGARRGVNDVRGRIEARLPDDQDDDVVHLPRHIHDFADTRARQRLGE